MSDCCQCGAPEGVSCDPAEEQRHCGCPDPRAHARHEEAAALRAVVEGLRTQLDDEVQRRHRAAEECQNSFVAMMQQRNDALRDARALQVRVDAVKALVAQSQERIDRYGYGSAKAYVSGADLLAALDGGLG